MNWPGAATGAACWRLARISPTSTEAQCNYYYAKLSVGQSQEAWSGAKELWLTGKNQPGACEPLFQRLARLRSAGSAGLSRTDPPGDEGRQYRAGEIAGPANARQLPEHRQRRGRPGLTIQTASSPSPAPPGATDFTRQMAAVAFASVARQDVENARLMIPSLVQAQQLNEDQTQELRDIVAWRLMGSDVTEEQAIWRDDANHAFAVHARWWSGGYGWRWGRAIAMASTPGWRVCSMEAKEKGRNGATGRTDLLLERGRDEEAQAILRSLMQQRGFYPMVAAQRLGEESIPSASIKPRAPSIPALASGAGDGAGT